MALTTSNMGLKQWDQPNDIFSYTDLANNFGLIDQHDHSSGKGIQVPNGGIANLAVDTTKLADNSVTNAKLAGSIADSKLASPFGSVYRNVAQATGSFSGMTSGTTYFPTGTGSAASGANVGTTPIPTVVWNSASYSVAGKTTKMRVVVDLMSNSVAPGFALSVGLIPVSSTAGSSGQFQMSTGSAVITNLYSLPSLAHGASFSSDVSPPADGDYLFYIQLGGAQAAGSIFMATFFLQVHHV